MSVPEPLARINAFYMRRVLQRWQRGEIDKRTAIDLLYAAALRDDANSMQATQK